MDAFKLGIQNYKLAKYDAALDQFYTAFSATQSITQRAEILNLIGEAHLMTDNPIDALSDFQNAYFQKGDDSMRLWSLANVSRAYTFLKNKDSAHIALSDALGISGMVRSSLIRAFYHEAKAEFAETMKDKSIALDSALGSLGEYRNDHPFRPVLEARLKIAQAESHMREESYTSAWHLFGEITDLGNLHEMPPVSVLAQMGLGRAEQSSGHANSWRTHYQNAARASGINLDPYHLAAVVLEYASYGKEEFDESEPLLDLANELATKTKLDTHGLRSLWPELRKVKGTLQAEDLPIPSALQKHIFNPAQ
ncbi:MAG: hypothetical protein ABIH34_07085 [Nanoarchaeota archaeon]